MEETFNVTKLVQKEDPSYTYCHVLGHKLSSKEVQKDPSKWKDVITRCPSGVCSNGCLHGGFQERFKKESLSDSEIEALLPELRTVCEKKPSWNPTGVEQSSCYHAVGHLTMYLTKGEIKKALPLCDKLTIKDDGRDYSHLCYDGSFMQIFQTLDPEDEALVKGKQPTKLSLKQYCDQFTGAHQGSCVSESWPLFNKEIITPDGFTDHCLMLPSGAEQDRCYRSLFYVVTPRLNFDIVKINGFCSKVTPYLQQLCYANAASRMIETDYKNIDSAVSLCAGIVSDETKQACFSELDLYATYNFHPGSKESNALCSKIPNEWKTSCID